MKKVFILLAVCLVLLLSCKNMNDVANNKKNSIISLRDEFSSTIYRIEKEVWQFNKNNTFELRFNKSNNTVDIIWVKVEDGEDKYINHHVMCLRKVEDNKMFLDFSPFINFSENITLAKYLSYEADKIRYQIQELEEKQNKTNREKERLNKLKDDLEFFSSEEEYKKTDPKLETYNLYVLHFRNIARLYKQVQHIAVISDDKLSLTFPKFFFQAFEYDQVSKKTQYDKPVIFDNVVFKKR